MRLTLMLLRKRMPPGNIWTGKHRMIPKITEKALEREREQIRLEERNMFYLRHPYLTEEQEKGHVAVTGKRERQRIELLSMRQRGSLKPHSMMEDHLLHLRSNEGWE